MARLLARLKDFSAGPSADNRSSTYG
jgi:hypothetical protein